MIIEAVLLAAVSALAGAAILWTSERRYWNYQQDRLYRDWVMRQTYGRRDSQRQAMEQLITDVNRLVEEFVTAVHLALSAETRRRQAATARRAREAEARSASVGERTKAFNAVEERWYVEAPVLRGRLHLQFGSRFEDRWQAIARSASCMCGALNHFVGGGDGGSAWALTRAMRDGKDALLIELEDTIDAFVRTLEPGAASRAG